jgi:hypothetical protein
MTDERVGNVHAIRNYMIKLLKRYKMEMDLMKNVVIQNSYAFESNKDILEQYDRVKRELQSILDYNFYDVEIKAVEDKELE